MADEVLDARDAALTGLLDDAGLFPPARLEPAAALESHLIRRRDDRAWLIRRLLTPVHLAEDLHHHVSELDLAEDLDSRPIEVGVVLGRVGAGTSDSAIERDLVAVAPLRADERVEVTSLELSVAGRHPDQEVSALLEALAAADDLPAATIAVEVAVDDRPAGEVVKMLRAIAAVDTGHRTVAKARVGITGSTPSLGDVELAGFLLACAENRIGAVVGPGLSAAVRSPRKGGGVEHGMLNVLAAAVVAYRGGRLAKVEQVLVTPGSDVRLGSGALIVGDEVIESEVLASCRADFLLGIGSVDPDHPIAALTELGVLQAGGARA